MSWADEVDQEYPEGYIAADDDKSVLPRYLFSVFFYQGKPDRAIPPRWRTLAVVVSHAACKFAKSEEVWVCATLLIPHNIFFSTSAMDKSGLVFLVFLTPPPNTK